MGTCLLWRQHRLGNQMAKYYVTCLDRKTIVNAGSELKACVVASDVMNVTTAGISWIVSERGFEKHEDDVMVPDHDIIAELLKRNGN